MDKINLITFSKIRKKEKNYKQQRVPQHYQIGRRKDNTSSIRRVSLEG